MKLINPKFEELIYDNPLLLGERCTRICYKSENLIKEGSAKRLLAGIINSGHVAMIEHIPVYLSIDMFSANMFKNIHPEWFKVINSSYAKVRLINSTYYVSTNLRVLYDASRELCDEFMDHDGEEFVFSCGYVKSSKFTEKYFYKRITIVFTMDRIGSQSFCRHRVFSFAQESTRWCNYLKDKFGNELSIITPCWCKEEDKEDFVKDMEEIEKFYFKWINKGYNAEEARTFLPSGVKTEIIMTGFADAWEHFFDLRTDSHAHQQARELAIPLQRYMKQKNYIVHKISKTSN